MPARRRKRRRFAGLLVLLGCFAVLGATFTAGYLVGRHGTRIAVVTGVVKPRPPAETRAAPAGTAKATEPALPRLTFYQELTAPLTSPPRVPAAPSAKPPKPEGPETQGTSLEGSRRVPPEPRARAAEPPRTVLAEAEARPAPTGDGWFTVQVAAYGTHAQAAALRARLAARGFAAEVNEADTAAGTRYRVRVGAFATREEARAEADRLTAATKLAAILVRLRERDTGDDGR